MANKYRYNNGNNSFNNYNKGYFPPEQNAEQGRESNELNLRQLSVALWRHKGLILAAIIIGGLIAALIAFLTTPVYQSTGSILIYNPQNKLSSLGIGGGSALGSLVSGNYDLGLGTSLDNELEVLRSRKLSLNIADSLLKNQLMSNGKQYPITFRDYPDDSTLTTRDSVALRLSNRLLFKKAPTGADVIYVQYESPSAMASGGVVNVALSQFNKLSNRQKYSTANSTASFLKKERSSIKDSLNQAERKLRQFMNNHKVVEIDAQTQQLIQQMADLEKSRQQARAKYVAASAGIKKYKNEMNKIVPGLAEQYSEAVGPDISKLQYAKSELEVQKQQMLAKNPNLDQSSPRIAKLNRQINSFKKRIKELSQKLVNQNNQYLGFLSGNGSGVANNVSTINEKLIELEVQQKQFKSQIDVISKQLKKQRAFFNRLPNNMIALAKLKRDVKINEEIFETISKQYAQTSIRERSQFGLGRIIDRGYAPEEPARPDKLLYIVLGVIAGLVLSAGYVFVDVAFTSTIFSADNMRSLKVPLLAVIPSLGTERASEEKETAGLQPSRSSPLVALTEPNAPASEAFRELEDHLVFPGENADIKTIVITSMARGDGKTTTIANLGVVLAETGHKVVIVDADFRQPALHTLFDLSGDRGITDVLSEQAGMQEVIKKTKAPNLSLLPAGKPPESVAAITRSPEFLDLLDELCSQFDFVLVDTAAAGRVRDATPVIKHADGTVIVAKFGKSTQADLHQLIQKLHALDATILGSVLTAYRYKKSTDVYAASDYNPTEYGSESDANEKSFSSFT